LEHHAWLGVLGVKQGHWVHTQVHHDLTNHLEIQTCCDRLRNLDLDFDYLIDF
jgi:hypothetical protein